METDEPPDPQEVQEALKVEECAVVLALRDTYVPGLDGSDAVMFATLLADLFPNVQVPLIFDNYGADTQGSRMQMNDEVSNLEEIPVLSKYSCEAGEEKVKGEFKENLQVCLFSCVSSGNRRLLVVLHFSRGALVLRCFRKTAVQNPLEQTRWMRSAF